METTTLTKDLIERLSPQEIDDLLRQRLELLSPGDRQLAELALTTRGVKNKEKEKVLTQ